MISATVSLRANFMARFYVGFDRRTTVSNLRTPKGLLQTHGIAYTLYSKDAILSQGALVLRERSPRGAGTSALLTANSTLGDLAMSGVWANGYARHEGFLETAVRDAFREVRRFREARWEGASDRKRREPSEEVLSCAVLNA